MARRFKTWTIVLLGLACLSGNSRADILIYTDQASFLQAYAYYYPKDPLQHLTFTPGDYDILVSGYYPGGSDHDNFSETPYSFTANSLGNSLLGPASSTVYDNAATNNLDSTGAMGFTAMLSGASTTLTITATDNFDTLTTQTVNIPAGQPSLFIGLIAITSIGGADENILGMNVSSDPSGGGTDVISGILNPFAAAVPELDPGSATAAITVLCGCVLTSTGRRRRE